jgi:hypothetical protein
MFTTPCFIRKNTPELRARLEELGYNNDKHLQNTYGDSIITRCDGTYHPHSPSKSRSLDKSITDCSKNEDLFLALAAIRDDSDYMQWIICLKEYHKGASIVEVGDFKLWKNKAAFKESHYWRKATVEELIKHFNK